MPWIPHNTQNASKKLDAMLQMRREQEQELEQELEYEFESKDPNPSLLSRIVRWFRDNL